MAESAQQAVRYIPAPYIKNLHHLVPAAARHGDVVFYRTGGFIAAEPLRDFIALGPFQYHAVSWNKGAGTNWQTLLESFYGIDTVNGPLAGYFSYEAGFAFEERWRNQLRKPRSDNYAWRFAQCLCWYVADHASCSGSIMAMEGATKTDIELLLSLLEEFSGTNISYTVLNIPPFNPDALAALSEMSQTDYEETVGLILEDIYSGRYYELNFTQRFRWQSSIDPAAFFGALFDLLQPRCGMYCGFGTEAVSSFSPELYIRKTQDHLCTRPIKGSMPVGVPAADWEKLFAEHVMVVDLSRNDIGRVSDRAPVSVDEFVVVKEFGGLRHVESSIIGRTSRDWKEILAKTYPAASITGCPKIEVVQAIQNYERSSRHIYTGSCGVIWPNGDMDMNVTIRTATAVKADGKWKYEVGAGGAIVSDSDPASEYAECLRKVHPLISGLMGMNNSAL